MALNSRDLAQTLNGIRGRFYHFMYEYIRTDITRAGVFRMIESLRVLRSRDFIFPFLSLFFFRLPRVRDHFRISPCIVRTRTKRQTARDSRHGINIDLRILP